jgi:hypothetical protein
MATIDEILEREILETARAKADRGEPLEPHERSELNLELALTANKDLLAELDAHRKLDDKTVRYTQGNFDSVRLGFGCVLVRMYALSANHSDKRQALESEVSKLSQRIAELEAKITVADGFAGGRSIRVNGTYNPNKSDEYSAHEVVALNGASFVARFDRPGPCPGPGWQLLAAQGKRGVPGQRGPAGPKVARMEINGEGLLLLTNADGSQVKCDLYPVLDKMR